MSDMIIISISHYRDLRNKIWRCLETHTIGFDSDTIEEMTNLVKKMDKALKD